MRKLRRQYSCLFLPFLLFLAAELIVACPGYALLSYVDMADLHCDTPADDHQNEEDRCLICVVKSSMEAADSRPFVTPLVEESETPALLVISGVLETRLHSIRPPPVCVKYV